MRRTLLFATPLALAGCITGQSALHPASADAEGVARLFWVMVAGGAVIWLVVIGSAIYAVMGRVRPQSERAADHVILAGGVVFPTVTLSALLVYGLALLPDWRANERADLHIQLHAEQYWWRVTYSDAPPVPRDVGEPPPPGVETANEVILPVGAVVDFHLTSPDVIHSFWIPPLGGKMDAIPGRANVLRLKPRDLGVFRGVCAEFCGAGHAFMAMRAEVVSPELFEAWRRQQAQQGSGDASTFVAAGCGACHTVRGLVEQSRLGPDLTHMRTRASIAGVLPNTAEAMRRWIRAPRAVKPDARMPGYAALPEEDLQAIVTFLIGDRE